VIARYTPWHASPALLMNSEHGRGRQFPHQWQGQEVEDQLMESVTGGIQCSSAGFCLLPWEPRALDKDL